MSVLTALAEREKGSVPISMGTALAVQGLLGTYPERPESPPPIRTFKQVWFNVYTLYRNLIATLSAEQHRAALPGELASALTEDMLGAASAISTQARHCEAIFYLNDYSNLAKAFPHAKIRVPATQIQEINATLEHETLRAVMRAKPDVTFRSYGIRIEGHHPATAMLTHFPVDLLNRYQFDQLQLIESNTGKLKGPSQWNTKLTVKEQVDSLPFNAFTLQIFGDRSTQFNPQSIALRRCVLELAQSKDWTSVTTMEKIKLNISSVKDQDLLKDLQRFL